MPDNNHKLCSGEGRITLQHAALGHPTLNALRTIFSTYHLSFKFLTSVRIAEITSNIGDAWECYLATIQVASSVGLLSVTELNSNPAEYSPEKNPQFWPWTY